MTQKFTVQGRIVWGHPTKLSPKKDNQKNTVMKDGQPVMQCAFGIAIERNTFYRDVLPLMLTVARSAFPQANFDGRQFVGVPPKFAWKYKDGDIDIDDKGRPYSQREGFAGHVVLTVSTQGFAPPLYKHNGVSYVQINENEIKCGDYAAVNVTIKYNGSTGTNTPGLYVNPEGVVFLAYMPEIVSASQNPEEMFAGMKVVLPAGASTTPVMSNAPLPSTMAAAPVAVSAAVPVAAPVAAVLPQPAHDFVHNAMGTAPAAPMPPAPPAAPAVFPPAGWLAHPSAPGYFYQGQEVLTEADLRARAAMPGMPAPR